MLIKQLENKNVTINRPCCISRNNTWIFKSRYVHMNDYTISYIKIIFLIE